MELTLRKKICEMITIAEKRWSAVESCFLTPAEQAEVLAIPELRYCNYCLWGGSDDCERKVLLIGPAEDPVAAGSSAFSIEAVKVTNKSGSWTHRDLLGALMGLGIKREFIGDIRIFQTEAYIFCRHSVKDEILRELSSVGRNPVSCEAFNPASVPAAEFKTKAVSFTVQSARFDAVLSGSFSISRTEAAEAIRRGLASKNHLVSMKPDSSVEEGDVLILRGKGKCTITEIGGTSRKGRIFVRANRYL